MPPGRLFAPVGRGNDYVQPPSAPNLLGRERAVPVRERVPTTKHDFAYPDPEYEEEERQEIDIGALLKDATRQRTGGSAQTRPLTASMSRKKLHDLTDTVYGHKRNKARAHSPPSHHHSNYITNNSNINNYSSNIDNNSNINMSNNTSNTSHNNAHLRPSSAMPHSNSVANFRSNVQRHRPGTAAVQGRGDMRPVILTLPSGKERHPAYGASQSPRAQSATVRRDRGYGPRSVWGADRDGGQRSRLMARRARRAQTATSQRPPSSTKTSMLRAKLHPHAGGRESRQAPQSARSPVQGVHAFLNRGDGGGGGGGGNGGGGGDYYGDVEYSMRERGVMHHGVQPSHNGGSSSGSGSDSESYSQSYNRQKHREGRADAAPILSEEEDLRISLRALEDEERRRERAKRRTAADLSGQRKPFRVTKQQPLEEGKLSQMKRLDMTMADYMLFQDNCKSMLVDHEEHAKEARSKAAARREAVRAAKRWQNESVPGPVLWPSDRPAVDRQLSARMMRASAVDLRVDENKEYTDAEQFLEPKTPLFGPLKFGTEEFDRPLFSYRASSVGGQLTSRSTSSNAAWMSREGSPKAPAIIRQDSFQRAAVNFPEGAQVQVSGHVGTVVYVGKLLLGPGPWVALRIARDHGHADGLVLTQYAAMSPAALAEITELSAPHSLQHMVFAPHGLISAFTAKEEEELLLIEKRARANPAIITKLRHVQTYLRRRVADRKIRARARKKAGQTEEERVYLDVDTHALNSKNLQMHSAKALATHLLNTSFVTTPLMKLRVLYRWVCAHILLTPAAPPCTVAEGLVSRRMNGGAMASLFAALCSWARIPCLKVVGKGCLPSGPGLEEPSVVMPHCWNACWLLEERGPSPWREAGRGVLDATGAEGEATIVPEKVGRWVLIDCCWSSGVWENGRFVRDFSSVYFDCSPEVFALQRFPMTAVFAHDCPDTDTKAVVGTPNVSAVDQFMEEGQAKYESLRAFEDHLPVSRTYLQHPITLLQPSMQQGKVRAATPYYTIAFEATEVLEFTCSLRHEFTPLPQACWMVNSEPMQSRGGFNKVTISLCFPERGGYAVLIACRRAKSTGVSAPLLQLQIEATQGLYDTRDRDTTFAGFLYKVPSTQTEDSEVHPAEINVLSPVTGVVSLHAKIFIEFDAPWSVDRIVASNNGQWELLTRREPQLNEGEKPADRSYGGIVRKTALTKTSNKASAAHAVEAKVAHAKEEEERKKLRVNFSGTLTIGAFPDIRVYYSTQTDKAFQLLYAFNTAKANVDDPQHGRIVMDNWGRSLGADLRLNDYACDGLRMNISMTSKPQYNIVLRARAGWKSTQPVAVQPDIKYMNAGDRALWVLNVTLPAKGQYTLEIQCKTGLINQYRVAYELLVEL